FKLPLDVAVAAGQDVILGCCGSTSKFAFLSFLASMLQQWCFVCFSSSGLDAGLSVVTPSVLICDATLRSIIPPGTFLLRVEEMPRIIAERLDLPPSPRANTGNLANLIFTSGSTGVPKAVTRSHEELYAFLWIYAKAVTPDDAVHLAYQPYSHLNEQLGTVVAFLQGTCIAFSSSASAYADAQDMNPTSIQGVPRFFEPLLLAHDRGEVTKEDVRLSFGRRLHSLAVGSAPVGRRLLEFLQDCFGSSASCSVINSYGATE
ncbi:unnamed protein product, partial [Polarella glacialis]